MNKALSLDKLIYKNYLKSSLVPIFAIELILLALYFGVSYYITKKSQETLITQATTNLIEIGKREAYSINNQLLDVSRLSQIMRKDHERFFKNPTECFLPNGEPEFKYHQNGVYYKSKDNGGSSTYYESNVKMTPQRLRKSRCSEALDPLMKSIVQTNPIITQAYLNTYDSFNRLYPFMPDAPQQYGANLDVTSYNFYYLADKLHNPEKKPVWTSTYLDPAGQGWMLSNIFPIYNEEKLEGVSGLDVTIDSLLKHVLALDIPWSASAFMVDKDGVILAMPKKVENFLGIKELTEHNYQSSIKTTIEKPKEFNIFQTQNSTLRKHLSSIFTKSEPMYEFTLEGKEYIITQHIIQESGWRLMILLDKSMLFEPIQKLKEQIDLVGFGVIFSMVLFYILFFLYLLRKSKNVGMQIAQPIHELSVLTKDLGSKKATKLEALSGISEVDTLTQNFNRLSTELDTRTEEYIQSKLREKMIEKDAEIAYRVGLFESASSYLHNIGNTITVLNGKVIMLRNLTQALQKSKMGFAKLQNMIGHLKADSQEKKELESYVSEFDKALSENVVEELKDISDSILQTTEYATQTIRHQQNDFNQSHATLQKYEQRFNIVEMLNSLLEDYHIDLATKGIEVKLQTPKELNIQSVKFQFHSGISNLLKNAIESIQESPQKGAGLIEIVVASQESRVRIAVSDNGVGLDAQHVKKMFSAGFTTKKEGHGLGLHAFNNFLHSINGTISVKSEGINQGATIEITLGA